MHTDSPDLVLKEQTLDQACDRLRRAAVQLEGAGLSHPPTPRTVTTAHEDVGAYMAGVGHALAALSDAAFHALALAAGIRRGSTALDTQLAAGLACSPATGARGGPAC